MLRRCRVLRSWRRGGRAPTVRRRRTRRKGDDREAYRRAEENRDLEAERASALEWADVARARADAEEARLRAARREADAVEARLRELERRRHALPRPSPPTTPRRDAPARPSPSPLVTRPEPSPEKPRRRRLVPVLSQGADAPGPYAPTRRRAVAAVEPTPVVPRRARRRSKVAHLEHTPEPTPRQWPPFGQTLIGAHVKIHVEGVWLRGEITDIAAAMPELEGGNGVCVHRECGEDEWHEYGSDEVRDDGRGCICSPASEFGEELVGHYVQVHVAGAWLDAVIVEAEVHEGREEICIQYAKYPSADPEWHLYDSEDIIYRDDPSTPGASHMSRATPDDPESPRVIDATPQRVPASATPKVISEWKRPIARGLPSQKTSWAPRSRCWSTERRWRPKLLKWRRPWRSWTASTASAYASATTSTPTRSGTSTGRRTSSSCARSRWRARGVSSGKSSASCDVRSVLDLRARSFANCVLYPTAVTGRGRILVLPRTGREVHPL